MLGKIMSMRRWVAVVVLISMMPLAIGGCYGRFPLTKTVYNWNGEVHEDRWVKTIVMWVLVIFPVYSLAMFADAIIFNLVEFWGGEPLMTETAVVDQNGNTIALKPTDDPNEAVLTVLRGDRVLSEERFVRVSDSLIEVRGDNGELRGTVVKTDAGFALNDRNGVAVGNLDAESIASLNN